MPLGSREDCGTNHDGTSSEEYCHYCFQDGAFTSECTMEQMIEHCARFVEEFNKENGSSYTKEEAIAQMTLFHPLFTGKGLSFSPLFAGRLLPAVRDVLECLKTPGRRTHIV